MKLFHIPLIVILLSSGCASNQRPINYHAENLSISNANILLLPLDVWVLEFLFNGKKEQHMTWTKEAKENLYKELPARLNRQNMNLIRVPIDDLKEWEIIQRTQLMKTIRTSLNTFTVNNHIKTFTVGDRLQVFKERYNADYVLLLFIRKEISSGGKIAGDILFSILSVPLFLFGIAAGGAGGVILYTPSFGSDFSYAVLMDTNTGSVSWYITSEVLGDIRTREGAQEAIEHLFKTFP